jgi:hypothetical protein
VKGRVKRKRIENKEKNEDAMVAVTCIQGAISLILFTDLREAEYRSV